MSGRIGNASITNFPNKERRTKMKRLLVSMLSVAAVVGLMAAPSFGADKLLVKDAGANTVFVVQDTGNVGVGTAAPAAQIHAVSQTSASSRGIITEQNSTDAAAGVLQFRKSRGTNAAPTAVATNDYLATFHAQGYDGAAYQIPASLTFQVDGPVAAGSVPTGMQVITGSAATGGNRATRLVVTSSGRVGIGTTAPAHLIQLSGGAYSDGAVWTDASSRTLKENIENLSADKAMDALKNLNPVVYNYKTDTEQKHVGFIAEDVPDLVAMKDRKSLTPMDIVAVLTKVVQEQSKTIDALSAKVDMLEKASK